MATTNAKTRMRKRKAAKLQQGYIARTEIRKALLAQQKRLDANEELLEMVDEVLTDLNRRLLLVEEHGGLLEDPDATA